MLTVDEMALRIVEWIGRTKQVEFHFSVMLQHARIPGINTRTDRIDLDRAIFLLTNFGVLVRKDHSNNHISGPKPRTYVVNNMRLRDFLNHILI